MATVIIGWVLLHTKQNVHQCIKLETICWRPHRQACHPPIAARCYPLHSYKWENDRNTVYACVMATGVFTGLGVKIGSAAITQTKNYTKLRYSHMLAWKKKKKKQGLSLSEAWKKLIPCTPNSSAHQTHSRHRWGHPTSHSAHIRKECPLQ